MKIKFFSLQFEIRKYNIIRLHIIYKKNKLKKLKDKKVMNLLFLNRFFELLY